MSDPTKPTNRVEEKALATVEALRELLAAMVESWPDRESFEDQPEDYDPLYHVGDERLAKLYGIPFVDRYVADPATFDDFQTVLYLLSCAIFGSDCDGDCCVLTSAVDRSRFRSPRSMLVPHSSTDPGGLMTFDRLSANARSALEELETHVSTLGWDDNRNAIVDREVRRAIAKSHEGRQNRRRELARQLASSDAVGDDEPEALRALAELAIEALR